MEMMESQTKSVAELHVLVNGRGQLTKARTLADLIAEIGLAKQRIATAVNGDFVPERARTGRALADGDQVEIVSPRQGG